MEELKIIKKLESLKGTKPNAEWVLSAKRDIISKQFEKAPSVTFASFINTIFSAPRVMVPAFASIIVALLGFTVYTAQSAMPGDRLYAVKQATEDLQMSVLSPQAQSVAKVNQAEERLSELDNITKQSENQGNRLAAGISEVKKALSVASKELANVPENQQAAMVGQIVSKISKIEKTTNASIIDDKSSDYQALYKSFADSQIKELETNENNLTAEQKNLLLNAKESFSVGDYSKAIEFIYQIQPQTDN